MAETVKAIYACEKHAAFSFRVGEVRYKFEKHQLIVEDADEIVALDDMLAKNIPIGSKVKKVSLAQAEALVKNHQATHGGAKSGPFGSNVMGDVEKQKIIERDATLGNMTPEAKAELTKKLADDSGLIVTEKVGEDVAADTKVAPAVKITPNVLNLNKG